MCHSWFLNCLLFNFLCMSCLDCGLFFVCLYKIDVSSACFVSSTNEDSMMNGCLSFMFSESNRKDSQNYVYKTIDTFCNKRVCKVLPKPSGSR